MMDRTPKPGELYRHFKNKLYQRQDIQRQGKSLLFIWLYMMILGYTPDHSTCL